MPNETRQEGQFGEPWVRVGRYLIACEQRERQEVATFTYEFDRNRAIACVNALSGIDDVSTVAAKIRLADAVLNLNSPAFSDLPNIIQKLVLKYAQETSHAKPE